MTDKYLYVTLDEFNIDNVTIKPYSKKYINNSSTFYGYKILYQYNDIKSDIKITDNLLIRTGYMKLNRKSFGRYNTNIIPYDNSTTNYARYLNIIEELRKKVIEVHENSIGENYNKVHSHFIKEGIRCNPRFCRKKLVDGKDIYTIITKMIKLGNSKNNYTSTELNTYDEISKIFKMKNSDEYWYEVDSIIGFNTNYLHTTMINPKTAGITLAMTPMANYSEIKINKSRADSTIERKIDDRSLRLTEINGILEI